MPSLPCDKCGEGEMVEKAGKFGIFLACSRYPDCDNTKELEPTDAPTEDLEEACRYYARVFSARISKTLDWQRDGLHVRYAIVMFGTERLMLVQPFTGNLKALMDSNGEGTIYRHCYSTPDIEAAYDELIDAGVQPENETGKPLSRENLQSPSGTRIIWLPKRFGHFSIELLEEKELEAFIKDAFAEEPAQIF